MDGERASQPRSESSYNDRVILSNRPFVLRKHIYMALNNIFQIKKLIKYSVISKFNDDHKICNSNGTKITMTTQQNLYFNVSALLAHSLKRFILWCLLQVQFMKGAFQGEICSVSLNCWGMKRAYRGTCST